MAGNSRRCRDCGGKLGSCALEVLRSEFNYNNLISQKLPYISNYLVLIGVNVILMKLGLKIVNKEIGKLIDLNIILLVLKPAV